MEFWMVVSSRVLVAVCASSIVCAKHSEHHSWSLNTIPLSLKFVITRKHQSLLLFRKTVSIYCIDFYFMVKFHYCGRLFQFLAIFRVQNIHAFSTERSIGKNHNILSFAPNFVGRNLIFLGFEKSFKSFRKMPYFI